MDTSTKPFKHFSLLITPVLGGLLLLFFMPPASVLAARQTPPANFKIAFIGDQGLGPNAVAVLNLIKAEGAQAVMHSGDLDYVDNPAAWEAQINGVLGADFPYFVSIGNHDELAWRGPNGYQHYLQNRFNRLGISWSGNLGVQSTFYYQGIFFVLTAPGITNGFDAGGSDLYIRDQLAADDSVWSICSWHKNMRLMQVGGKADETGWGVYEEARKGGAIIATAHEHSYSRTHLLSSVVNRTVASTSNTLNLTKGDSFAFVSGLGGHSVRAQSLTGNWWASVYASTCLPGDQVCQPNATHGALFGVFNVDGQPNKAFFYFKDINGRVVDSFTVVSYVEASVISGVTPSSVLAGEGAFTLTVDGAGFVNGSVVRWNNTARPTTFVSPTRLTAAITAADVATAGTPQITVANPGPGGGVSNAVTLSVNNPLPVITSLAPSAALAGSGSFTLAVNGSGFNSSSSVLFNGSHRATTFLSPTQLSASVTADDVAAAGTASVTVANPTPGGGTSNASDLTVNNPVPTLASISQGTATAGDAPFVLTLSGTGFNTNSVVRFANSNRATTFISPTQLTAAITAADVATAGVFALTVFNPTPGGGTSGAASFTVNNPAPAVTTLSPQQATAGGADFTLVVNGTGFVDGSVVRWNDSERPTIFLSQTQLTAAITLEDIATSGGFRITVVNPAPGGGASNATTFYVNPPPPKLLTEEGTGRAIALDSVTWVRDPFTVITPYNFSLDKRTRVSLFATDVNLSSAEDASVVTAQAEDSQQRIYPLAVEFVGGVSGFEWLTQVIVKLPDELENVGEVWVSINVRGISSNKVLLSVRPSENSSP